MNEATILIPLIIVVVVVILSFIIMPFVFNISWETLWAGTRSRHWYYIWLMISIIGVVIIAWLNIFYYNISDDCLSGTTICDTNKKKYKEQLIYYYLIFIPMIFWMLATCLYFKYNKFVFKVLSIAMIIISCVGSILLNIYMYHKKVDKYYYHYWIGFLASIFISIFIIGKYGFEWGVLNFLEFNPNKEKRPPEIINV